MNSGKQKFIFSCVFWGKWHTSLFADVLVPSLLTPRNLPALSQHYDVVFDILTTSANRHYLESSRRIGDLRKVVELKITEEEYIPAVFKEPQHQWWLKSLADARRCNALLALFTPDACYSDGSLEAIGKRMQEGAACVYLSAMRITGETFIPDVIQHYLGANPPKTITYAELIELSLRHSHPFNNGAYIDSPDTQFVLEYVLKPVKQKGWVKHCYCAGPCVFIDANAVELDWLNVVIKVQRSRTFHVIASADEAAYVSVAPLPLYGEWYYGMGAEHVAFKAIKQAVTYRSSSSEAVSATPCIDLWSSSSLATDPDWEDARRDVYELARHVRSRSLTYEVAKAVAGAGYVAASDLLYLALGCGLINPEP